jgi:hypothetical protein
VRRCTSDTILDVRVQVMAFAVIMTICFLRIDNDQVGVQNKLGFLYEVLSLLFVGQLNAIAMCTLLPSHNRVCGAELSSMETDT